MSDFKQHPTFEKFIKELEKVTESLEKTFENVPELFKEKFGHHFGQEPKPENKEPVNFEESPVPPAPPVPPTHKSVAPFDFKSFVQQVVGIPVFTNEYINDVLNGNAPGPQGLNPMAEAVTATQFAALAFTGVSSKPYFVGRIDRFFAYASTVSDENFPRLIKAIKPYLYDETVFAVLKQSVKFDEFCHTASQDPQKAELLQSLFRF